MASPRAAISASWRACSDEDATRSAALWLTLFASWGRSSSRLRTHHCWSICRGLGQHQELITRDVQFLK